MQGGGVSCQNSKNTTFGVYNKVPHWVDYIMIQAELHDEQICISKLKL